MRKNVAYLLTGRFLMLVSGLLAGVILARVLKPQGQGAFTLFATSAVLFGELGFAGLYASLTYHIGKDRDRWREYVSGWLSLLLLLALAVNLIGPWFSLKYPLLPGAWWLLWLMLNLGLVLAFVNSCQATFAGREDFLAITKYSSLFALVQIPGLLLGLLLSRPNYIAGAALGFTVANLIAAFALGKHLFAGKPGFRFTLRPLVPLLIVGGNAFLMRILWTLLQRSDNYLIHYMRTSAELGLYARAVGLVELLLTVPNLVGIVLFSRVAGSNKQAGEETAIRTLRCLLPFVLFVAAILGVFGGWLLRLLYGAEFAPGYGALLALLPGLSGMAYGAVASGHLAGIGYPRRYVAFYAVSFLANLLLNLWFIPRWGIVGAGISSSIAYDLLAVLLVRELLIRANQPARAALLPSWRELRGYLNFRRDPERMLGAD